MSNRALLLDRDGVVNVDYGYVGTEDRLSYISGIFSLVQRASRAGMRVIVVTNQSGIGRGYYSVDQFKLLMSTVATSFYSHGGRLDAVYFCPHHPCAISEGYRKVCDSRKPAPGMILRAAARYDLDLSNCVFVGDQLTDTQAASAAGVGRIYRLIDTPMVVGAFGVELVNSLEDVRLPDANCAGLGAPSDRTEFVECYAQDHPFSGLLGVHG